MDPTLVSVLMNNLDIEALKKLYQDGSDDIKKEINQSENIRLLVQRLGWTFVSDYNQEYNRLKTLYADDEKKLEELELQDFEDQTYFDADNREDIKNFDDVLFQQEIMRKKDKIYHYITSFFTQEFYRKRFAAFYAIDGGHDDYNEMLKSQRLELSADHTFGSPKKLAMLIELIDSIEEADVSNVMEAGYKSIETSVKAFLILNHRLAFFEFEE